MNENIWQSAGGEAEQPGTSVSQSTPQPAQQSGPAMVVYRDPADVRTHFQFLLALLTVLGLLMMSAIGNAWQYWRRPDRIVVDRSSGRVLLINDRKFGETDAAQMTPDGPGEADK